MRRWVTRKTEEKYFGGVVHVGRKGSEGSPCFLQNCCLAQASRFVFIFVFCFLGPHLRHMEVPRLGV